MWLKLEFLNYLHVIQASNMQCCVTAGVLHVDIQFVISVKL